ncbi:PAS domain-containing protein [Rhodoferax sp.]|uniref:PAS domain-containing protein n=1 Tax=Rhodoferax sp. TaxID=50421 RepID=UPI002840AB04|nr:PAS domain-containing protein [Rhodoferax sp.]MDR3369928.1 PAS domain-containing protein [Rhodoferax sp.]
MQVQLHELQVHQIELEMQNEELRHTQLALQTSRDSHADLYDHAPTGYLCISDIGLITQANLTAATLLGTPRSQLIQQPLSHFIFRDDEEACR